MDRIEYRPYAKIITHSTYEGASKEDELITIECQFWRFILPELNTHRVMSRNYQSSRAVPIEKLIQQVRDNPAIPVHWGKNQRGMVAEQVNHALVDLGAAGVEFTAEETWRCAASIAANYAEAMHKAGYHKQIVNRLLEPFMWTRGVITATRGAWESVFALRCHPDSQPEFQALAYKVKEALETSTPKTLKVGQWHLPYVKVYKQSETEVWELDKGVTNRLLKLSDAIKISTSCCAQVSYRMLDDSLEKALKIYDMLNLPEGGKFKEAPAHMSPCEHQACFYGEKLSPFFGGNFETIGGTMWAQHRKILELGVEKQFIKQ